MAHLRGKRCVYEWIVCICRSSLECVGQLRLAIDMNKPAPSRVLTFVSAASQSAAQPPVSTVPPSPLLKELPCVFASSCPSASRRF